MTTSDRFDRDLLTWLDGEGSAKAPAGLHEAAMHGARSARQRPGWLVALRGVTLGPTAPGLARPTVRTAYLLVTLTLILAALVAAALIGAFRTDRLTRPLLGNGAIAFAIQDIDTRPYNHVHLMGADGSSDHEIGQGSCPTFSADGTLLTYQSGWDDLSTDTASFVVAAASGASPRVVPGIRFGEGWLSPDGTKVAWMRPLTPIVTTFPDGSSSVSAQTEIWVTPVEGGLAVRVSGPPADAASSFWFPVWSPDSKQLAFAVMAAVTNEGNSGSYRSAIDVADADGSHLRQLTGRPGTDSIGISWSPDGRYLAYTGLPDGSPLPSLGPGSEAPTAWSLPLDVFVVGADGAGDRNLTDTGTDESDVQWSPDGSYLAYFTEGDGGMRLTTLRMNGRTAAALPSTGPESDLFTWAPDGKGMLAVRVLLTGPELSPQQFHTTFEVTDAQFRQAPVTLFQVDHSIGCPPSWQGIRR